MGQRLGRLNINNKSLKTSDNSNNHQQQQQQHENSKILNNKSVTITIRMLKMEPTAVPVITTSTTTTTSSSSLCGSYGGCTNNNNDSCNSNNNNNNICDSHLISNNLNNQTHINSSNINNNNNNFSTNSDCSNIINNNNNSDDTINDISNSFKINLNSTSGGQLIKQSNNNYDQHKITLVDSLQQQHQQSASSGSLSGTTTSTPTSITGAGSTSLEYLLNLSNLSTAASSCNNHHNHQNHHHHHHQAVNNEVPSTSLTSSPSNNHNNSNNNGQAIVPCENCRRKLKPKLCKTCRNLSKCTTNDGNGNEKQATSKKGNWCIARFKRGSNSNNNKTAANNNNNNNNGKVNNNGGTVAQQQQQSITVVNNNISINNNRNCNCNNRGNDAASASANTTTTSTTTTDTSAFQLPMLASPTPQQLRTASLQFYQPQNNQIIINNSVSESGDVGRIEEGGTTPSTATLLQRFYSPNGNNFVFVLNQGQPLIDVRLAVDDPALEDCDEQARIQRAKEIAEGVEPPPGFKPNPQVRPQQVTTPQIASGGGGVIENNTQLVGHTNGGSLMPAVQTTASNTAPAATTGPPQWHMVQTFNLLANNILLQNGMFLSPDDMPKPHSQVDFIHCLVPDLQKITSCSFYWGKMDRYEAERLLEGKPEGTFLLRDSAQEEFLFSVSFRKYTRSLHARIEQFNHKFSFDSHDPGVYTATTVTGLLEHYKDPTCVMFFEPMLTIPLNRNFPFSLQQLCRATIVSNTTYDGINNFPIPSALKSYLKEYHYKQRLKVRRFDEPAEISS